MKCLYLGGVSAHVLGMTAINISEVLRGMFTSRLFFVISLPLSKNLKPFTCITIKFQISSVTFPCATNNNKFVIFLSTDKSLIKRHSVDGRTQRGENRKR